MAKDKVMHPTNQSRGGDVAKPTQSANIAGPVATNTNLTPHARNAGMGKKN